MVDDRGRDRDQFAHVTIIEGLKELQAELKAAGPEHARKLQQVNKRLVDRIAEKARAAVYSSVDSVSPSVRTGPERIRKDGKGSIGRTRASIRGNASGREARVVAGGPKALGFWGHEFGGSRGLRGPGRRVTQASAKASNMTGSAFRAQVTHRAQIRNRTRMFPVHLGRHGYFLYPTIRAEMPHAFEDWNSIFDEVFGTRGGPA